MDSSTSTLNVYLIELFVINERAYLLEDMYGLSGLGFIYIQTYSNLLEFLTLTFQATS